MLQMQWGNLYPVVVTYIILGVILAVMIAVCGAAQPGKKLVEIESGTGLLAGWWKWINRPPQGLDTLPPKYATDRHVESWLCPICGAKIARQDVEKLEYGYNIECKYCGAAISYSQMRW